MKAPVRTARRVPQQMKRRVRAYSTLIYRAHKEVNLADMRSPDFMSSRFCCPRPVLLRLVSSEASRLSKTNRLKVITLQEIHAAVTCKTSERKRKRCSESFSGELGLTEEVHAVMTDWKKGLSMNSLYHSVVFTSQKKSHTTSQM
ncbi:hypothetical protein PAMP_000324 [Pampus punctatissimus]